MIKNPTVTVVLPTYNRAKYLADAVQSILNQTFPDLELIVVDDGSTDETRSLLNGFTDARIKYIYQSQQGISAAMNTGITAASGRYIARLDSDDIWLPEMLAIQVSTLENRTELGLVYAKAQGMDANGNPLSETRGLPLRYFEDSFKSMLYHDSTCNITVVVRSEYLEKAGRYDESLPVNEDWDMWLRVARHCQFGFTDTVVARYRYHDDNITQKTSLHFSEHVSGRGKILDKIFLESDLPPSIIAIKHLVYQELYLYTGRTWLLSRNYSQAFRFFLKAIRSGLRPLRTIGWICWLIIVDVILMRFTLGRRFADLMARIASKYRQQRQSS